MNFRNRVIAGLGATALLASTVLGAVAADTASEPVSVKVNRIDGGTVSVQIAESQQFSDVVYSLNDVVPSTGKLLVTVSDTRGTATGWDVTLKATDFIKGDQTVGENIPVGQFSLTADATNRTSGFGEIPTSKHDVAPVGASSSALWEADSDEGDGVFTLELGGTLNVPAGTLVDTYTSTVTVDVAAAP
jgi:hypothetical protein